MTLPTGENEAKCSQFTKGDMSAAENHVAVKQSLLQSTAWWGLCEGPGAGQGDALHLSLGGWRSQAQPAGGIQTGPGLTQVAGMLPGEMLWAPQGLHDHQSC